MFLSLNGILFSSAYCSRIYGMALKLGRGLQMILRNVIFYFLPSDPFLDLFTRCVQEPVLTQSLGSYTRFSLRERERWLSETVSETLHVDPACSNATPVYCSSSDFEKRVAVHVPSLAPAVMEAMQPYAVRIEANPPEAIALPDGQLQ